LIAITENNSMQVKIADVGLSRIINTEEVNVLTAGVGSFYYMSPEIRAVKLYDFKTDIW
jgi:serine/threonine protein kinase